MTEGSPMPTARGALTAVFIGEILYAIGGEGENEIMDTNEAYNSKKIIGYQYHQCIPQDIMLHLQLLMEMYT
jgi:hypothetical protein